MVWCKRKRVMVNEWQLAMRKDARFFLGSGRRVLPISKFFVVIVVVLMMVVRTKQQLP